MTVLLSTFGTLAKHSFDFDTKPSSHERFLCQFIVLWIKLQYKAE